MKIIVRIGRFIVELVTGQHREAHPKPYSDEELAKVALLKEKVDEAIALIDTLRDPRERGVLRSNLLRAKEMADIIVQEDMQRLHTASPSPFARLKIAFTADRFLAIASIVGGVAAATAGAEAVFALLKNVLGALLHSASGAESNGVAALTAKDGVRYLILMMISFGFFCALGILTFSSKTDARKIAADMIKTILGVYVGMATKLVE